MTIERINDLSHTEFVELLGSVFEQSPWVAVRAWEKRPFASVEALHDAMMAAVEASAPEEQLALLCAQPETPAETPREFAAGEGGRFSAAGLPDIESLAQYRHKFGFPFVYCATGAGGFDSSFALMVRINDSREEELQQALCEVRRIAWFRLSEKMK